MPPKTDVTRKAALVIQRGSIPGDDIHIVYGTEKHRGYAFAWKAKGRLTVAEFRLLLVPPY